MPSIDNLLAQGIQPTTAWKSPVAMQQEQANLDSTQQHVKQQQFATQQAIDEKLRQEKSRAAWGRAAAETKDPDDFLQRGVQYGGSVDEQLAYRKMMDDSAAHHLTLDETQRKLAESQNNRIVGALEGVAAIPNPDAQNYQYTLARKKLQEEGINVDHLPPAYSDPSQINSLINLHLMGGSLAKKKADEQKLVTDKQDSDTRRLNAEAANDRNTASLRAKGLTVNKETGEIEALPYEQLPAEQQATIDLKKAQTEGAAALADLRIAQSAGDSAKLKLAQERARIAAQNANTALKRLGLSNDQFEFRTFGTVNGDAPAGTLTTDDGTPIGSANAANVRPTASARNAAERAVTMVDLDSRLRAALQDPEIQKYVGPGAGRASELEGRIGTLPTNVADFLNDLKSYSAFQAGLHPVRGLGGLQYFDEVMGGLGQGKDQLIGKLDSNLKTAKSVMDVGKPKTASGKASEQVVEWEKGPDGKPRPKAKK